MLNEYKPKESVKEVEEFPFADMTSRGIRKEITEKFKIRMSVSETDGRTPTAWYFPYYDQQNKLCGYKKRDLTLDKNDPKHFTAVGKVSVGCKMFGQTIAEVNNRKHNVLVLCEGEIDQLSFYQCAIDLATKKGYTGLEPFVTSISLGTPTAVDSVLSNSEFVKTFDKIIIFFDNDHASEPEKRKHIIRGAEATNNVAVALMQDNIFTVTAPNGYKDANDALMNGLTDLIVNHVMFDCKKFIGEKVISASEVPLDDIIANREEGVYVNTFPNLMHKIHGFRKRELVVLTAPSNVGKSFVCAEFGYNFLDAGYKVGFMMLEEQSKETIQRMLARHLKVNYNTFRDKPTSVVSKEQIQEAYNWLTIEHECLLLDHFGSMPIDEFMSKINVFHKLHKCEYIIVDHLSMLISGSKIDNERKELDIVMTELAAFCAANDVCIIAVSHLNRSIAADFKPPKGKENEPHWISVSKESMRGSSSLEQLAWCVLGLEPQIMPDKSRGNVRLTVLKNRTWGYLGVADEFTMNEDTGLLEVVNEYDGDF
jgi:archaellum biogenesis ATPase FlaH